jgi:excisionase family DNA binding protein
MTDKNTQKIDFDNLLTTDEAAELLRVSHGYLRNALHRGIGPQTIRIGRLVRYQICDIEAWLFEQRYESPRRKLANRHQKIAA